jgi:hypothetical protein
MTSSSKYIGMDVHKESISRTPEADSCKPLALKQVVFSPGRIAGQDEACTPQFSAAAA